MNTDHYYDQLHRMFVVPYHNEEEVHTRSEARKRTLESWKCKLKEIRRKK